MKQVWLIVWLIGGTQESARIARKLVEHRFPCVVTVTTESAIVIVVRFIRNLGNRPNANPR
ncbi:MAG: hypothetical protein ACOC1Z_02550 [Cyanobacteriota bacterium]